MPVRQADRSESVSNDHLSQATAGREPTRLADIQRARMIEAIGRGAAEVGAGNLTVADVVARAGVSRRTFYELFKDCEDCLLAAFDGAVNRVTRRAAVLWLGSGNWRWRIRSSLADVLRFLDDEPYLARLLLVEALGAGPRVLARRQQAMARLVAIVDGVRAESEAARRAPPVTAEAVVGGVASVLYTRLLEGCQEPLEDLLNPLMSMVVMPYLGAAAARRELSRPLPDRRRRDGPSEESPLRELGIRVTYRTASALAAVAVHPGASNRQIAGACGIGDQGQVSKLLARLERLGLVENSAVGSALRGAPNAWRLTKRGRAVHHALAARSLG
jgi:AcrR family transcriptional regulator/DNA-binding MarR family transcriptional regulator